MATLTLRLDPEDEILLEKIKEREGTRTGTNTILSALRYFSKKEKHKQEKDDLNRRYSIAAGTLTQLADYIRKKEKLEAQINQVLEEITLSR
jgi:hypothetical protein